MLKTIQNRLGFSQLKLLKDFGRDMADSDNFGDYGTVAVGALLGWTKRRCGMKINQLQSSQR
ncbi:MAG: hypothetical protein KJ757_03925 [Planctomycetes bacterium]|nr:hypothetical protein [Planctomycetota bacterium]MBU1518819.1 hypothetical protein [Planctomycetota bacterium]MBU2458255.1 hypothetical protein [Planctomycetota bacterium]MBU2596693.1 hypothetical protein [Planctomycetota bacterium]